MTLKGNKGEWSELYAFFKLLADGRLYCGDGQMNRYDDKFYPILEVFRNDAIDRVSYKVNATTSQILIEGDSISIEIPQTQFGDEASTLLDKIQNINANTDFSSFLFVCF